MADTAVLEAAAFGRESSSLSDGTNFYFSGGYTVKETVQTVNLAHYCSVGSLPTLPTISDL